MAQSRVSTLEGKEIADDYVRTSLPKGRWADTWDIFKSCFGKLVIINVLTLIFFIPGIALVYIRGAYVSQMGFLYPFASNILGTYPVTPGMQGAAERIVLSADLLFYSLLIVAGFIASVGIAGGAYSVRKLINTHGQFTVKGYFHGVKACYFNTVLAVTLLMVFVFASICVSDWTAIQIAEGASAAGPVTAKVFMIIATVIVGIVAMWLLAVGVSYRVGFVHLFKNTFVLLFATIIQTIFMLGFSLIPVWFLIIGMSSQFFLILAYIIFLFIGFSFILLCWFAYTQWVFDMFITPAVKTEKEAKRAKMTPKQLEAEKENDEKALARELLAAGKSELIGRPIRPIEGATTISKVGEAYGRAQIAAASQTRQAIEGEVKEYYEQHKCDTRYVEYERLFAEREKALKTPEGRKGKKKRVSSDNLLK